MTQPAASVEARGVRVSLLAWDRLKDGSLRAATAFGPALVARDDRGWFWSVHNRTVRTRYANEQDAQAAAQSDYNRGVLALLDIAPAIEPAPESELRTAALAAEMLKIAEELGEADDPFAAWEVLAQLKSDSAALAAERAKAERAEAEREEWKGVAEDARARLQRAEETLGQYSFNSQAERDALKAEVERLKAEMASGLAEIKTLVVASQRDRRIAGSNLNAAAHRINALLAALSAAGSDGIMEYARCILSLRTAPQEKDNG